MKVTTDLGRLTGKVVTHADGNMDLQKECTHAAQGLDSVASLPDRARQPAAKASIRTAQRTMVGSTWGLKIEM